MKVRIVGSSTGCGPAHQYAISYTVDGRIAIDAGCIGLLTPLEEQRQIRHVFLSHTHIDHIASLPLFLDNVYEPGTDSPTVYASRFVLDSLQRDIFNGRVWPELAQLVSQERPAVRLETLENEVPVTVEGLTVTPVEVDHVVPTFGFLVDDGASAVLFPGDTGPTCRVWEIAKTVARLGAVFLEASFPDSMIGIAQKSAHLTPTLLAAELQKLDRPDVHVVVVHAKRSYRDQIISELRRLELPSWEPGEPEKVYEF